MKRSSGNSYLFTSFVMAKDNFEKHGRHEAKKVIIFISDGPFETTNMDNQEVVEELKNDGVLIFSILFGDKNYDRFLINFS